MRFTTDIFMRAGMSAAHAATVADVLVWANVRGTDSHGVTRIPMYLELIEFGLLDPKFHSRAARGPLDYASAGGAALRQTKGRALEHARSRMKTATRDGPAGTCT